jgi:hypothetical protein
MGMGLAPGLSTSGISPLVCDGVDEVVQPFAHTFICLALTTCSGQEPGGLWDYEGVRRAAE